MSFVEGKTHRFTRKQHPNAWVQILPPRTTTNLRPCFWYSNHQFGVQWSPSHRLYCPERTQLEIWDRYTPVTKNAKWLDMFGTHQAILGLHLGGIAILGDVRWGYQGWPSPAIRKQEELGPLTPIRETYGNCMPEYESAESFRICTNHVCIMFEMKCLLPTKVSIIRGSSFCKLLEAASTFEACP